MASLNFAGGVRVAAADLNLDGKADLIVARGPGGTPEVRSYSGANLSQLFTAFNAHDAGFTGGVYVAAGKLKGDSIPNIVTGPGLGGGQHVRVSNGTNRAGTAIREIYAAYDLGFTGDVSVTLGHFMRAAAVGVFVAGDVGELTGGLVGEIDPLLGHDIAAIAGLIEPDEPVQRVVPGMFLEMALACVGSFGFHRGTGHGTKRLAHSDLMLRNILKNRQDPGPGVSGRLDSTNGP